MSKSPDILDRLGGNPLRYWQEAVEEIERLRAIIKELTDDKEYLADELLDLEIEIKRLRNGLHVEVT